MPFASGSLGTDTDAHETRLSQQAALIETLRADLDRTSEQAGNMSGPARTDSQLSLETCDNQCEPPC